MITVCFFKFPQLESLNFLTQLVEINKIKNTYLCIFNSKQLQEYKKKKKKRVH